MTDVKKVLVFKLEEADDCYNELWQTVPCGNENPKYYCRHTIGPGQWYNVCDPFGYRELDYPVPDDIVFVVCSSEEDHKPLFGVSNKDGAYVKTLAETAREKWRKLGEQYPHYTYSGSDEFWAQASDMGTTIDADKWLLTFKDPEIYGAEAQDYDENWIYHCQETSRDVIGHFDYLGKKYYFLRMVKCQTVCKKKITEYWVADAVSREKYNSHLVMFMGSYFVGNPGTMYVKRDAFSVVEKALREIYEDACLCLMHKGYGFTHQEKVGYKKAAEILVGKNFSRKYVSEVVEKEREHHSFWRTDDPALAIQFPGYLKDYSFSF